MEILFFQTKQKNQIMSSRPFINYWDSNFTYFFSDFRSNFYKLITNNFSDFFFGNNNDDDNDLNNYDDDDDYEIRLTP